MPDPSLPEPTPNPPATSAGAAKEFAAPPPPKRKRHWVLKSIGLLLVVVVLLVIFAPTIASTGPVRSFVLGMVNQNLNGRVTAADWKVGWTSGLELSGVKVYDAQDVLVLELDRLRTSLKLTDAVRGNYDLGQTTADVSLTKIQIDKDGQVNLAKLAKTGPPQPPGSVTPAPSPATPSTALQEPTRLPPVKGHVVANIRGGAIEVQNAAGGWTTYHVDPSKIDVDIPDVNGAITNDIRLACHAGNGAPGRLALAGTATVARNNRLVLEQLQADEKLDLAGIDLALLSPFVQQSADLTTGGVASGSLSVRAAGLGDLSADGLLKVDNVVLAGPALKGDTFSSKALALPIKASRKATGPADAKIKVEVLTLTFDQGTVDVKADASEAALQQAAALIPAAIRQAAGQAAPPAGATTRYALSGASGNASITADLDVAALARQLPNTIGLNPGTKLDRGRLTHSTTLELGDNRATIRTTTNLRDVAGTYAEAGPASARPVRVDPITVAASTDAVGGEHPDLRGLDLKLDSGFLNVSGGGPSLAKLTIDGTNLDLAKLQAQAAQVVDIDAKMNGTPPGAPTTRPVKLAGTGDFRLTTDGDLLEPGGTIATTTALNLNNVDVSGIGDVPPVRQDRVAFAQRGALVRGGNSGAFVKGVRGLVVTLQSGSAAAPVVDVAFNADVDSKAGPDGKPVYVVPSFELAKCNVPDLRAAQAQFGAFVKPLREQGIDLQSGEVYAAVKGAYDGTTVTLDKPLNVSVKNLTMTRSVDGAAPVQVVQKQNLTVTAAGAVGLPQKGGATTAKLSQLSVRSQPNYFSVDKAGDGDLNVVLTDNGGVQGTGTLALFADVAGLKNLASRFGGQVEVKTPKAGDIKSGLLNATVRLARSDKPETLATLDGTVTKLSVATNEQPIENETVKIMLRATSADDFSGVKATGNVDSSFATARLTDANVRLTEGTGATARPAGTWEMLQSAAVEVDAPDLARLYAVANAFTPPATRPAAAAAAAAPAPRAAAPRAARPVRGDERISERRPPAPEPAAESADPAAPSGPLAVRSGSAVVKLDLKRDDAAKVTRVTVSDFSAKNLSLTRGARTFTFDRDITLKLAAEVAAATDPAKPNQTASEQVSAVTVSQLGGDLGLAKLQMPEPIKVTNLGGSVPGASGAVSVTGPLASLMQMLAVVQGGEPMPYTGTYTATQRARSETGTITLAGDLTATDFRAGADASAPAQTIAVKNDLSVNPSASNIAIKTLSVEMPGSGALAMRARGGVRDYAVKREFEGLAVDLGYDLAKLWPLVQPMLTPEQREQYKDLKIVGAHKKTFAVTGSYPAADAGGRPLAFNESIRSTSAAGGLTVDDLATSGIEVVGLDVPMTMTNGVVRTLPPGGSGRNLPTPAAFNSGTLQLAGLTIDLTQPVPRLSAPKKFPLVRSATINPLLGETLGKYVNPVFAKAERAEGRLDVTVNQCDDLALGAAIKTPQSGRAVMTFSLSDMDIANPLGSLLIGGALEGVGPLLGGGSAFAKGQADTFRGQIRDAVVSIENGTANTDVTLHLVDPGRPRDVVGGKNPVNEIDMPLSFSGNVDLGDLRQNFNVGMPPQLLVKFIPLKEAQKIGQELSRALPNGVLPMRLGGTSLAPRITFVDSQALTKALLQGQLKGLLGGDGADGVKGGDPVGDIIGEVLGGGKKRAGDPKSGNGSNDKPAEGGGGSGRTSGDGERAAPKR